MTNNKLYYPCCSFLSDVSRCPICRSKQGRKPEPTDICLLTEQDKIWSGMLDDVLRQHAIPTITNSNIGAGMAIKAGSMFERVKFYVPYSHMEQAQQLVDLLFSENLQADPESDPTE